MKDISNATAKTIWKTHIGGEFPAGYEWVLFYKQNEGRRGEYVFWHELTLSGKPAVLAGRRDVPEFIEPEPEFIVSVNPFTPPVTYVDLPKVADELAAEGKEPADDKPGRWLVIYFKRSTDGERDRRKLLRLHGILTSYPGNDRFTIVQEDGRNSYTTEFPNHSTGYCEALHRDIVSIVGDVNLEVFDKAA